MDGIGRSIAKVRLEAPAEVKRIRIADFFAHNVDAQLLYGEQLLCTTEIPVSFLNTVLI